MNLTLTPKPEIFLFSLFKPEDPGQEGKKKKKSLECPSILASARRVADSVQITILEAEALWFRCGKKKKKTFQKTPAGEVNM